MQLAYSRDLEDDMSYPPIGRIGIPVAHDGRPVVDDIMRKGLCEVCGANKATQHIRFSMYGNVERMIVGGKTYNKATLTVSICDDCAKKATARENVRTKACGCVFLGIGTLTGISTFYMHGSVWAGLIAGALFGVIAAGLISSMMVGSHSRESICEFVPRIKSLLDSGWRFGNCPSKA